MVEGRKTEVEITLRQALNPVLRLAAEADSPLGCSVNKLAKEMANRKASAAVDKVSGLFYLLRTTKLPCYPKGEGPEEFWRACFRLLPPGRKLEILFDHPYRASDTQWFPTWEQTLSWPQRDPGYQHIRPDFPEVTSIQLSCSEGEIFRIWSIPGAFLRLHETSDSGSILEYEVQVGDRYFSFYNPYLSQEPIQTELETRNLEFTLAVPHLRNGYNWIVCEYIGKRVDTEKYTQSMVHITVLKKVGVLCTDDVGELLVGGKNGISLLEQIDCLVV